MKQKQSICIDNIYLNIDRYTYESDEMFYYRVNFIINSIKNIMQENNKNKKNNVLDNLNLFDIIGLSMIEMNKFFNKTNYN